MPLVVITKDATYQGKRYAAGEFHDLPVEVLRLSLRRRISIRYRTPSAAEIAELSRPAKKPPAAPAPLPEGPAKVIAG